jgi:DNA-binding transcriptional ArsR family regulator
MSELYSGQNQAGQNTQTKTNQLKSSVASLNHLRIKKVALIFRALNHKLRQEMLKFIEKNGKSSVTDIYIQLRMDQSVASQHLAILRRAGLLTTNRDGKFVFYTLNKSKVEMINNMIVDLLK